MELEKFISLIAELPENSKFKYVRGDDVCTYVRIDISEPRVYAKTPQGKDFNFAGTYLAQMAQKIKAYIPFNISQLMNNSGSNRPIIESILAHTKEFYWIQKDNAKYVVWVPSKSHNIGELIQWEDWDYLDEMREEEADISTIDADRIIINKPDKQFYTEEELIQILRDMYEDGKRTNSSTANLLLFALKYSPFYGNASDLCSKAGIPLPTPVSDGKKLFNLIKSGKYGVLFWDKRMQFSDKNKGETASHQIIYYGAPGTGKSHKIKEKLELENVPKENVFRTTFHPDSDYSTFVGAYKPFVEEQEVRAIPVVFNNGTSFDANNGTYKEKRITYKFVPQAFLQAYTRAYQTSENVYLVIEEINRGNCAQIFGDLFQLLDRDENGKSEYTINADTDLGAYLIEKLGEDRLSELGLIKKSDDNEVIVELCLPSNLYIYATMNTSDQSLFPIDSAFKRRWDWEYEPIKYKNTDWVIKIDDTHQYSWVEFQEEVNHRIYGENHSEDKMLGDYFVNPSDKIITKSMLLNKILFYLWNDVCKDGEGDIFTTNGKDEITFSELYGNDQKLIAMMDYLQAEYKKRNPSKEKQDTESGSESKSTTE